MSLPVMPLNCHRYGRLKAIIYKGVRETASVARCFNKIKINKRNRENFLKPSGMSGKRFAWVSILNKRMALARPVHQVD